MSVEIVRRMTSRRAARTLLMAGAAAAAWACGDSDPAETLVSDEVEVSVVTPVSYLTVGNFTILRATVSNDGVGASSGVIWSSSDRAVATVDSLDGVVVGIGSGSAGITATSRRDRSRNAAAVVHVAKPPAVVTVTPRVVAAVVGVNITFVASVTNDTTGPSSGVLWSSSAPAVATVDPVTGVAMTRSAGQSAITATSKFDPSRSGSATITVVQPLGASSQYARRNQ